MIDKTHYVPILKAKEGEFQALAECSPLAKGDFTPLLEFVLPEANGRKRPETVDEHVKTTIERASATWGVADPCFLDFQMVEAKGGPAIIPAAFAEIEKTGIRAIPVVGLSGGKAFIDEIGSGIAKLSLPVCLRVGRDDIGAPNFNSALAHALSLLNRKPGETHLLIDFKVITKEALADTLGLIQATLGKLPSRDEWLSVIFAGTSFPQNMSSFPRDSITVVDRVEWALWNRLRNEKTARIPTFSDFGIAHPTLAVINKKYMNPSASIRYTTSNGWLLVKGRSAIKSGYPQFHSLAKLLVKRPEYCGPDFCWGDQFIDDCAKGKVSSGSLTTWRKVGTSHHIALVIDQLANLS